MPVCIRHDTPAAAMPLVLCCSAGGLASLADAAASASLTRLLRPSYWLAASVTNGTSATNKVLTWPADLSGATPAAGQYVAPWVSGSSPLASGGLLAVSTAPGNASWQVANASETTARFICQRPAYTMEQGRLADVGNGLQYLAFVQPSVSEEVGVLYASARRYCSLVVSVLVRQAASAELSLLTASAPASLTRARRHSGAGLKGSNSL